MKMLMTILCLLLLASCGKDKLNESLTKTQSALGTAPKECTFTNLGPPVCAYLAKDNQLHDYFNAQYAECLGAEVKHEGHCDCSVNTILVCAEDGVSYTECEARQKNLKIVKYSPCYVKDM